MGDMFSTLRYYLYFSPAIQNRACLAAERADNWFSVCTFPRRQFTFLKGGDGEGWQLIVKVFPKATSRGNPQDLRKKLWNEFMKCRLNGEPTLRLHLLFNNCSFSDISTFFIIVLTWEVGLWNRHRDFRAILPKSATFCWWFCSWFILNKGDTFMHIKKHEQSILWVLWNTIHSFLLLFFSLSWVFREFPSLTKQAQNKRHKCSRPIKQTIKTKQRCHCVKRP